MTYDLYNLSEKVNLLSTYLPILNSIENVDILSKDDTTIKVSFKLDSLDTFIEQLGYPVIIESDTIWIDDFSARVPITLDDYLNQYDR